MRTASIVLAALLALLHGHAFAQSDDTLPSNMRAGARSGEEMARRAVQNTLPISVSSDGKSVNLPNQGSVPVNELLPGANREDAQQQYGAHAQDPQKLAELAAQKHEELAKSTSAEGEAYRAVRNSKSLDQREVENDAAFAGQTNRALNGVDLSEDFHDCRRTLQDQPPSSEDAGVIQHEETCEKLSGRDECTRVREIEDRSDPNHTVLDTFVTNITANQDISFGLLDNFDPNTYLLGATAQLTWSGDIANAEILTQPTADNGWSGLVRLTYNAASSGAVCTTETGATCTPDQPGCTCNVQQSVGLHISADINAIGEHVSGDCLLDSDRFCTAHWACTDNTEHSFNGAPIPEPLAANFTALYPTSITNTPQSSTSPLCWAAKANYDCPYNIGRMGCTRTPDGLTICPENTRENTTADTCQALRERPECVPQRSVCTENALGYGEHCYVQTLTYRCSAFIPVGTTTQRQINSCLGTMHCSGDECVSRTPERAKGFAKLQASLNVVQHLSSDTDSDPRTGKKTVFPGQAMQCRKALGGTYDTCHVTETGGLTAWSQMYAKRERQGEAAKALQRARSQGEPEQGSWSKMSAGSQVDSSTLNKPITSKVENVTAGSSPGYSTDSSLGTVTTEYKTKASTEMMRGSGWNGTEDEWTLGNQREVGSCVHVGSYCALDSAVGCLQKNDTYCCFNSPLSRSMREAIAGPNGAQYGAFGTAQHPNCSGVPLRDATQSAKSVDLTDWMGRMKLAGATPDNDIQAMNLRYSEERLYGSGSYLSDGTPRPSLAQRTTQRVSAIDATGTAKQLREQAEEARPGQVATPEGPGEITFAPAFSTVQGGRAAAVSITRWGSAGAVSVNVSTHDASAHAGFDYTPLAKRITWAEGESGLKTIYVQTDERASSSHRRILLTLDSPAGGAVLGDNPTGTIDIF